ncbi:MAG: hypothetical protein GTN89_16200, partial [Acidobacteria bacterium]|nr:hypothetical protein [Acidobacteriota bacterium]NIQ31842.1 hypothetical protein [Acidobacteriota bacterium]
MKIPSLTWYLDRVPEEIAPSRLAERLARDRGHLYVFDERDWARIGEEIRSKLAPVGR